MGVKFLLFCKKKKKKKIYFTHPLLQNTHINLSILNIYSIKYSFFYIFYYFLHTPLCPLTDPTQLKITNSQPPLMINPHPSSTHPATIDKINHHYQPAQPPSSSNQPPSLTQPTTIIKPASIINPPNHHHQATNLQLKTQIQKNLKLVKSTQIHMKSQNSLIKQRIKKGSKPTDQNPKTHLSNKEKIEDVKSPQRWQG